MAREVSEQEPILSARMQLGMMRPRTQLEHRNALAEWIDGHPEPEHLRVAAQARSQLIQLHMRNHEIAERALMQGLGMRSCPQQPARDGDMPDPKNTLPCRQIQPFRQGTEHQRYPMRRRFQPIQRRVETCAEGRATRLTAPPLDPLSSAPHTIAKKPRGCSHR